MENHKQKCQLQVFSVGMAHDHSCSGLVSNNSRTDGSSVHTEYIDFGDSVSETAHDREISVSDSESGTCGVITREFRLFSGNELIRLEEGDKEHSVIKQRFLMGMGSVRSLTTITSIHKNIYSSFQGLARLQSFRIFSQAMSQKCHGNPNIKFAWYGTSRDGVDRIISHGFGQSGRPENNGLYGSGLYLSPENFSLDSALSSTLNKNGLRHVLLCRVILGNMEEVRSGSEQFHPSSEEFDSGVDNLLAPRKYIIWSTHMNTHILPEYVISFSAPPCLEGFHRVQQPVVKPTSAWMPFPTLISVLARFLPPTTIRVIQKYHYSYREKKITREQLVQKVRQIVGDELLVKIIKSCRGKVHFLPKK
uniref:Poly [ADP-ribose] polymerase n=1 Tax=Nelumbo nucifera TaxID=4432 RepID=A0A822YPT1_NELNU|nr:TPA_asm: hypothetical protein HUJ06_005222 [Nelumbo nucifera]